MSQTNATDMNLSEILPIPSEPENLPLSYKIGGIEYRGLPADFKPTVHQSSVDSNITLFIYEGRHPSGLNIRVEMQCFRDFPTCEWVAYFTNDTDSPSPIVSDIRITGKLTGKSPLLVHSNGDDCTEAGYEIFRDRLTSPISLSPTRGTPCCGAFPYMRLCFENHCVNLAIGWTGVWTAQFLPTADGVIYSIGQKRCHMTILPGETMRTPRLTLMSTAGDETYAVNLWRKWYFAHIIPRENGKLLPPKLCLHVWNVDGPEFTGTTTEKQCEGLRTYITRGMKPDVWWIDAGWYPCNLNWPHTGTWEHDSERFPEGLGQIGEECDKNGVQFLVWFEPERVRPGTWLWEQHPEWLIFRESDNNALLDLGNKAACDWLIGHVNDKIRDYHIRIYRQDFNFDPDRFWNTAETDDRIGAVENLHIQGYLRYWDALLDANPELLIDSCASGGRRNDLDTMRRAVPLHYTDVGYGNHPIKQKQHRLMFEWIPYFRAHNMSWDKPDGSYPGGNQPPDRFAFHCALAPSLTNMTVYNGPESEFETASIMLPIWRRAAELELRGDYFPLTECRKDAHDWYALQFDDPDAGDGFVQLIRNTLSEDDSFLLQMTVTHRGKLYVFEDMETGSTLRFTSEQLTEGVTLSLPKRSGVVWFYRAISI